MEKLIFPPAFRGNFQQPLSLPIESATVPVTTYRQSDLIRDYPACHVRSFHKREAPGIAEDKDGRDGCYSVRRGDLCAIFGKFSWRLGHLDVLWGVSSAWYDLA